MRDATTNYGTHPRTAERRHLTQFELADRWRLSGRTLEKWRQRRIGPRHLRIGGRVLYPLQAVEDFEAASLRGDA